MKITPKMAREGKYNEGIQHQNAITSIAYALVMLPKVMPDYSCFDEFTAHSIFAAINETRKIRSAGVLMMLLLVPAPRHSVWIP